MPLFMRRKTVFTFLVIFIPLAVTFSSNNKGEEKKSSKKYAYKAALNITEAYYFIKIAFTSNQEEIIYQNIDSAGSFVTRSVTGLDSAIYFALETDSFAVSETKFALENLRNTRNVLIKIKKTEGIRAKQSAVKESMSMCKNALDQAHRAAYFYGMNAKEAMPKHFSKLDIDHALFSIVEEDLRRKLEEKDKEITELQKKNVPDNPEEKKAFLQQIKQKEEEEVNIKTRLKETEEKLKEIAELLKTEKKSPTKGKQEETIFSKSLSPSQQNNKEVNDEIGWGWQIILDPELPKGLVYKIQIGVYRKPISAEVFKGLTPVFGETMAEGIRYSAGIFSKLNDAQQAKDYIKETGLTDAFIIAYHNGKKISVEEAKKQEQKK